MRHLVLNFGSLAVLTAVCVFASGARSMAASVAFDFSIDPASQGVEIKGNNSKPWNTSGGNPGGFLALTYAENAQYGALKFPDLDGGAAMVAFKLETDLRVGNSTGELPADGFSVNFARTNDPLLLGDLNSQADFAVTGCADCGATTGISVSFDTWSGHTLPDGPDTVGIIVRVDNKTISRTELPTRHGDCGDNTSLQTGPRDPNFWTNGGSARDAASWADLCWSKLLIELFADGKLTVEWKGRKILDGFQTPFFPSAGRFLIAGRTGGANQHVHFDNLKLVTTTSSDTSPPTVPVGFKATAIHARRIKLEWSAATDNSGKVAYEIERDGVVLPNLVNAISFADTGLSPESVHTYRVRSVDPAGNRSAFTSLVTIKTPVETFVFTEGVLKWEAFLNIGSSSTLDGFTSSPKYPKSPDEVKAITSSSGLVDFAEGFGTRISGFVIPQETADYVFFFASDDQGALFLSTDESPANLKQIAAEANWTGVRQWTFSGGGSDLASKRSDEFPGTQWPSGKTISLTAGKRYYVEALAKEGGGGDHVSFTMVKAGTVPVNGEGSLSGKLIGAVIDPGQGPALIAEGPKAAAIATGGTATMTVKAIGSPPLRYQWYLRRHSDATATAIPGATSSSYVAPAASTANAGYYSVSVTNDEGSATSAAALLTLKSGNNDLLAHWSFDDVANAKITKDQVNGLTGEFVGEARFGDDNSGRTGLASDRALNLRPGNDGSLVRVSDASWLNSAGDQNQITVAYFQKLSGIKDSSAFWITSSDTDRAMQVHSPWSDQVIFFDTAGCCDEKQRINANATSFPAYHNALFWESWHHFAFVKNGDTKKVFIDGRLFLQGINTAPLPRAFATLLIGGGSGLINSMNGLLDDFAVFAKALSDSDVAKLAAGVAPSAIGTPGIVIEEDVTLPGDKIAGSHAVSASPPGEQVGMAIDNDVNTKYMNFNKVNAGFTVTPQKGPTVVNAIALVSANDVPERDPASYKLEGSNDGVSFALISEGAVPSFAGRYKLQILRFANSTLYTVYRVTFPTVQNATLATSVQIAEVELLGKPSALSISVPPSSQTLIAGASVTLSVVAKGTAPVTYQWKKDGTNIPGAIGATLALNNVTAASTGSYTVLVTDISGSLLSAPAILSVTVAPTITAQPQSQTVNPGANLVLGVTAAGTAPLTYQWRKDGVNITGATSSSLSLNNVSASSAGSYTVVVGNAAGTVTSAAAVLAVSSGPTISVQPQSQAVNPGASLVLGVTATGTAPLTYQWRKDGVNINGATSSSFALNNVNASSAGSYTVLVSNAAGTVTSAAAILTVNSGPTITGQPPQTPILNPGQSAVFSVTATGTGPLSYQWRKDGVNIAGATSASLALNNVTAASAGSYTVVVSNSAGSVTSAAAVLTVRSLPVITVQPQSAGVNLGSSVTFSVTATGTAPLSYQWKKDGVNVVGAISSSLTLNSVSTAGVGSYTVVVSNLAGSVTSAAAVLTINSAPTITVQPLGQAANPGANVTLSVTATGTAPLTYQWRKDGVNIAGGTSLILTLNAVSAASAGSYTVVVSNSAGTVTSSAAVLSLNTAPSISTQPQPQTVAPGATARFSVIAVGTAPLSYQWRKDGVNIVGAVSSTLTLSNVTSASAGTYSVLVSNALGSLFSAGAALTVNSAPVITAPPQSQAVNVGTSVTFTVVASGTAPLSYQWKKDQINITGGTGASLTLGNVSAASAGSYTVQVSNSAGSVTSAAAVLSINTAPSITTQPKSQTVTSPGVSVTFSVVATGTAPLSYQWRKDGANRAGATEANLVLSGVTISDAGTYTVLVSNVAGSVFSAGAVLEVKSVPVITAQPLSQSVSPGSSVTFSVTATGTPPLTYQWRKDGVDVAGAVGSSLSFSSVSEAEAGTYTVVVSTGGGSVVSAGALLTITSPPAITSQPQSQSVSPGAVVTFSVVATGTAPLSYLWRKNGVSVPGATASSLTLSAVSASDAGTYSVVVSNSAGSVFSAGAVLSVTSGPVITAQPQSQVVALGAPVVLSVTAYGTPPLTYQWRKNGTDLPAANGAEFKLSAATSADVGDYSVVVSNVAGSVTSAAAALAVNLPPFIRILKPQPDAFFGLATTVVFEVEASDFDGTITKVEFYQDGAKIGEATAPPFSVPIANLAPRSYSLSARAFDDRGASTPPVEIRISVAALQPQTITFSGVPDKVLSAAPIDSEGFAQSSSGLPVTLSVASGPARLIDGFVYLTGAGRVTLRATQLGNGTFASAPEQVRSFNVTLPAVPPVITVAQGTSATIEPIGAGVPGVTYEIVKPVLSSSGVVVVEGQKLRFTPNPAYFGATDLRYRITDSVSGTLTEAVVDVVVLRINPVFQLERGSYVVSEGAGVVLISIFKNISDAGRVLLTTRNITASALDAGAGDFTLQEKFLDFASGETSKRIAISIIDDQRSEGNESFELQISANSPSSVAEPAKAIVTIVDDDSGIVFLDTKLPGPIPPREALLKVGLVPPEADGRWRFVGEFHWRANGSVVEGLLEGPYEIEFKPANNYVHPLPTIVNVVNGTTTFRDFFYLPSASPKRGNLMVTFEGTTLGGWKLEEEPDSSYRLSGTPLNNLNAGIYSIQFRPVDGLITPGSINAEVRANNTLAYSGKYVPAPPSTSDRIRPTVTPVAFLKYPYIGEISRADGELGSGFVVRERVVVTAAHVVYDQKNLADARRVRWHFQKHKGSNLPQPLVPRGWYLYEGYAARRRVEGAGSASTVFSQNLDAAVLFFAEPAGRGGFGGYLGSTTFPNEWLTGSAEKMLSGYPINGIPASDQEKIHETNPVPLSLTPVPGLTGGMLYRTPELLSFPGNSGGPLCVRHSNGRLYPAGIFVALDADSVYVKSIDQQVVDLMNQAELSSITGTNASAGGVVNFGSDFEDIVDETGVLRVLISPEGAVEAGAGWRFAGGNPAYVEKASSETLVLAFDLQLEFKAVPGFVKPANRVVPILGGITNSVTVRYLRSQQITFAVIPDQRLGANPLFLEATADSQLPVVFQVVNGPVRLLGNSLVATGVGRATVRAVQEGNADYASAFVERSFEVLASGSGDKPPLLSFSSQTGLILSGTAGSTYRIEVANSLETPPAWAALITVTASSASVVIPNTTPSTQGARFYRAILASP